MLTAQLPSSSSRGGFYFRIDLPVPPYPEKAPENPSIAPPLPHHNAPEPETYSNSWMTPASSSHSLPNTTGSNDHTYPSNFNEPTYSLDHTLFQPHFNVPPLHTQPNHSSLSAPISYPTQPEPHHLPTPSTRPIWPAEIPRSHASSLLPLPEPSIPHRRPLSATLSPPAKPITLASDAPPLLDNHSTPSDDGRLQRVCTHCKATTTPLWRRGPNPSELLCNACGLYLQARGEYRPQRLIDEDRTGGVDLEIPAAVVAGETKQCANCFTQRTTVWRRDKDGRPLCNACGVYLKMKGRERPVEFRKDKIRRRKYRAADKTKAGSTTAPDADA